VRGEPSVAIAEICTLLERRVARTAPRRSLGTLVKLILSRNDTSIASVKRGQLGTSTPGPPAVTVTLRSVQLRLAS